MPETVQDCSRPLNSDAIVKLKDRESGGGFNLAIKKAKPNNAEPVVSCAKTLEEVAIKKKEPKPTVEEVRKARDTRGCKGQTKNPESDARKIENRYRTHQLNTEKVENLNAQEK